jgi:PAS domain S-box-containing protein
MRNDLAMVNDSDHELGMLDRIDWRILLIDDEEDIRDIVAVVLKDAGYRVETAVDGVSGMAACRQFSPHIVITDIRMPRMDGLEVLKQVKADHPEMEVIVATAFAEMSLAVKALQLDASDFVTKPIDDNALMVALNRAMQRYRDRRKIKDYTRFLEKGWDETTLELMETYAYQQKLIQSSMDGILGCDAQDRVITFNRSLEQMTGYTQVEVIGTRTLSDLFEPDAHTAFRKALENSEHGGPGQLALYETCIYTKEKAKVPVQLSATLIQEEGKIEGLVCFFRDLRQLRRLEREMADQARMLQQDKMISLGRLAASVAHEINNPLSGILNYLRLMARILDREPSDAPALAKFSRYLETAIEETDRCSQIVSHLLTFSRKSAGKKSPLPVNELLQRCAVLSRHRLELADIRLKVDTDNTPMRVLGDMNQLQQCIINLIFNAIDAMAQGGQLNLSAQVSEGEEQVRICVKDTGCGIPPQDKKKIFEPFYTTKKEGYGVGLGLSTTYGIVHQHGGHIEVESTPGKGSQFCIVLDLVNRGGENQ